MWACASLFRRFTDTDLRLKYWKLATKYLWTSNIRIFFYSVRLPTHGFAVYDTIHFDGFFYEFGNQIREFSMSKPASHEFSFHDTKHMSLCKPRFYPNTLHVALGKIAGIVEYAGVWLAVSQAGSRAEPLVRGFGGKLPEAESFLLHLVSNFLYSSEILWKHSIWLYVQ